MPVMSAFHVTSKSRSWYSVTMLIKVDFQQWFGMELDCIRIMTSPLVLVLQVAQSTVVAEQEVYLDLVWSSTQMLGVPVQVTVLPEAVEMLEAVITEVHVLAN